MSASATILLLTLLFLKHFVADFLYQPPFQWQNKGTYGHPGGLFHAGQHVLATFIILALFKVSFDMTLALVLLEFIIHYHMDWAKMKYNKYKGWGATTHNEFWILLGVDQLVHSLTYLGMAYLLVI